MAIGNLPKGNNERVAWSINFEAEFPALGADLGFTPAEITDLIEKVGYLRFLILRNQKALAFSKACSQYKSEMLSGVSETQEPPKVPAFNDIAEPAAVGAGIVPAINKALQRIKLSKNYSETVAQTLMIAGTQEAPLDFTTAKPFGQALSLADFTVRIEWIKGKFDGVIIESKRGTETSWTRLDRDFRSPFDDTRPPLVSGQPEERRYRLRYFNDDEPIGEWSDEIVATARP